MGEPLAFDVGLWFSKAFSLKKKRLLTHTIKQKPRGLSAHPHSKIPQKISTRKCWISIKQVH